MAIISHIEENEPSPVALTKHSCPLCSYEWWELTDAGDYPYHCPGCGEPYSPWDSEVYAEAEQERKAQLPCKVGDTVFQIGGRGPCEPLRIYESAVKSLIFDTTAGFAFDERAIGKTVFLTRAEAEAALKAREAGE